MSAKELPAGKGPLIPEVLGPAQRGRYNGLNTLEDVKRHIARACRKLEKGMDPEQGRAIVYALKALASLMQEMDTERRLAEMEEALAKLRAIRAPMERVK